MFPEDSFKCLDYEHHIFFMLQIYLFDHNKFVQEIYRKEKREKQ